MTEEERDAALERPCPACNARANKRCTAPTNTGRREVKWVHYAREQAA